MSEYQYYGFQAIDQPLSEDDMRWLRGLSTRAQIAATSLVNDYYGGSSTSSAFDRSVENQTKTSSAPQEPV